MIRRQLASTLLLLLLVASAGILSAEDAPLRVTFMDVGQGDAVLVQTPSGRVILIDGGEGTLPDFLGNYAYNAGNRVVLPWLRHKGIDRIDTIVVTHADSDHAGGLIGVLEDRSVEVGEILDTDTENWEEEKRLSYGRLTALAREREIPIRVPKIGDSLDWGEGLSAMVVWVQSGVMKDVNDAALSVRLTHGKVTFLLASDLGKKSEDAACERWGDALACTVLKVGHHGSKFSTSEEFAKLAHPRVAVISSGAYNNYGHPTPEAIGRLRAVGAEVLRTDLLSCIEIVSDGETIHVKAAGKGEMDLPKIVRPEIAAKEMSEHLEHDVLLRGVVRGVQFTKGPMLLTFEDAPDRDNMVVVPLGIAEEISHAQGLDWKDLKGRRCTVRGQAVLHANYGTHQILVERPGDFTLDP